MLSKKRFYNSKKYLGCLSGKSGNNKTLSIAALIIIAVIVIFLIWYYWSAEEVSDAATEQENLEKWARDSLKSEYVPDEVEAGVSIRASSEGENLRSMRESSWNINNQNFITQISYNKDNSGINYYAVIISYSENITLDENYALGLLNKYFKLPETDLSLDCGQSQISKYCTAKIEDTIKKDFLVSYLEMGDMIEVNIAYLERPIGSESYEKENVWV